MDHHQGREQRGQAILNWAHERDFPGARTWYSQAVAAAKMTSGEDLSELRDRLLPTLLGEVVLSRKKQALRVVR